MITIRMCPDPRCGGILCQRAVKHGRPLTAMTDLYQFRRRMPRDDIILWFAQYLTYEGLKGADGVRRMTPPDAVFHVHTTDGTGFISSWAGPGDVDEALTGSPQWNRHAALARLEETRSHYRRFLGKDVP